MEQSENTAAKPIAGLCLAVRTDAGAHQLSAFLDYHLRIAERAVILAEQHPGESMARVLAAAGKFGTRVRVVVTHEGSHSEEDGTCAALAEAVAEESCDVVLHLDKDEFLGWPEKINGMVERIRAGKSDFSEGRIICRFAPGGDFYPRGLPSYSAFCRAAPVRTQILSAYGFSDLKAYLFRSPHVCLRKIPGGWRKDTQGMPIEQFRRTFESFEKMTGKHIGDDARGSGVAAAQETDDSVRCSAFSDRLDASFRPHANDIPGWFDFADLYRIIVRRAPERATVVELGVWLGKSLSFLGEYAALLGKELEIVGYDQFDPSYYLGQPEPVGGDWLAHVRNTLSRCVPWNTPGVVRSKSDKAAANHGDGSVFACFIDAGHAKDSVIADLRAWMPKIAPGGILAGHDINHPKHPGVRHALDELGMDWLRVSESSWLAFL